LSCILELLSDHVYLATWGTAAGTIAAVITALVLAFRNSSQVKTVVQTLAIPDQISFHERAAKRLAKNGQLFTAETGPDGFYVIPCDPRALRRHKAVLDELHTTLATSLKQQSKPQDTRKEDELDMQRKLRNVHLLRPHIDTLIALHDELEKITGVKSIDPDNIEQGAEGDAADRAP
jgi:hypothetical protein